MTEQVPRGFPRPDVQAAYPDHARAECSGFRLTTTAEQLRSGVDVILFVKTESGLHRVSVSFETRAIQTIELNEATCVDHDHELHQLLEEPAELEKRFRRSLGRQRGLTLRLDIINKCNLRCVMCHFSDDAIFRRPTSQLTAAEFERLFDDIAPSVCKVVLSCGDEPLVSKHLPAILEYLARAHPEVAIEFCTTQC